MKGIGLIVALVLAAVPAAQAHRPLDVTASAAAAANFREQGAGLPFAMTAFSHEPGVPDYRRLYPRSVKGGLSANLSCRLTGDLTLQGCRVVESDPISPDVQAYALKLAHGFAIDRTSLTVPPDQVESIDLYLHVDDGRHSTDGRRPCLPPLCVATMPPPAPPPQ